MSLLPNDTYANALRPLWAAAGSGGGGGSSLQSPASVIPDGAGDVTLDMNGTGTGTSTLTLFPANGAATIILNAQAGADNAIHFSDPASVGIAVYSNDTTPNVLDIGDLSANVVASFDNGNNEVRLCDIGAPGTVGCNGNLFVESSISAGNSLAMYPDTPASSVIFQTIANNGSVGIGSSSTYPDTLTISDVARPGIATYLQINGTAASVPLFIAGAQGPAGGCSIYPDALPPTAAQLIIGSDASNNDHIVLTATATNLKKLGGAPQVLLAAANLAPGTLVSPTTFSFNAPAAEGLYAIVGASSGISTANSRQAQLNAICYVGATGVVAIGGAAYADIGTIAADDCIEFAPVNNNVFNGSYVGSQQVNNFQVLAFKISGAIPGTF